MAAHSPGPNITVGDSGRVNRNVAYLEFYTRYLTGEHHIEVLKWAAEMPVEPDWLIVNSPEPDFRPPAKRVPRAGEAAYLLESVYPFAGLSGMHFAVYRRSGAAVDSPTTEP